MNDNITVSRELLRQVLDALECTETYLCIEVNKAYGRDAHCDTISGWKEKLEQHGESITALRTMLDAPADEPVAEVVWSKDTDYEFKFKMLVELACKEGEPVKLYAGPFESGGLYWHDTETDKPAAPIEDVVCE